MDRKHKILCILLPAILFAALFYVRSDGFLVSSIQGKLESGISPPPSSEIVQIFQEPLLYLAKGRQCFVFATGDGRFVVKFLNYRRFSFPHQILQLPLPPKIRAFLTNYAKKRGERFQKTVTSFQLAEQYLAKETGLVYVHLQEGVGFAPITLIDPLNRVHLLDPNRTAFIVQKKVTPIYEAMHLAYKTSGIGGIEECIRAYLSVVEKRAKLCIADDDYDVEINFGFFGKEPILLDPGRLFVCPELKNPERYEKELSLSIHRFRKWVLREYPDAEASFTSSVF